MDPCLITKCEHSCVVVPGDVLTARCLCPKGYDLSSDRVSCDEENECLTRNGGCQHFCTNIPGSYECSCIKGYKLADNGFACEGAFNFHRHTDRIFSQTVVIPIIFNGRNNEITCFSRRR